jgi:hypothetical protein
MTKDNTFVGMFRLDGIPPAPRGVPRIEVTFERVFEFLGLWCVNPQNQSVLIVHAEDKTGGNSNRIIVMVDESCVTRDDLEHRVMEAERYEEEDRLQRKKAGVHNLFVRRSARAHCLQPPVQRLVELSCMQLWCRDSTQRAQQLCCCSPLSMLAIRLTRAVNESQCCRSFERWAVLRVMKRCFSSVVRRLLVKFGSRCLDFFLEA